MTATLALDRDKTFVICDPHPHFLRAVEEAGATIREQSTAIVPWAEPVGAWTPRSILEHAALYADLPRAAAKKAIDAALAAMEIDNSDAKRTALVLDACTRRKALVATALVVIPQSAILEDPLAGLDDARAEALGARIVTALEGIRWTVFAGVTSMWNPLVRHADEVLTVERGVVTHRGPVAVLAAASNVLAVRGNGDVGLFSEAMRSMGVSVSLIRDGRDGIEVEWPAGKPRHEIFGTAERSGFAIDEITPRLSGLV